MKVTTADAGLVNVKQAVDPSIDKPYINSATAPGAGQNSGLALGRCVARELRCTTFFAWQAPENPQNFRIDHDAGASMSTIETVIFWLMLFWTPGLAFMGFLLLPKPTGSDQVS
jgi:hypothetical protein